MRSRGDLLRYGGDVPMVFQDPFSSINPVCRVSHGMLRSLLLHRRELGRAQRQEEARRVLEEVGLTPAADVMQRFPHELSGGQRQRLGFAQALALRPKLILADEPVSMLDVSIRVGLLNLMAELRERQGVSILYITHDMASARYVADRLVIMYAGRIAEEGPAEDVLARPKHPYTQLLLSAVPDPRAPLAVGAETDKGEPPRVIDPAPGCRFRWRGPLAVDECHRRTPELRILGPGHSAACPVASPDAPAAPAATGGAAGGRGGRAKAMRTGPVVLEIGERARRRAPSAWIIDFTNPVGIVTRALLDAGHRAVGLCNVAIGFQRRFAGLLGVTPERVTLDHVGLNHLSWERAVIGARADGTGPPDPSSGAGRAARAGFAALAAPAAVARLDA